MDALSDGSANLPGPRLQGPSEPIPCPIGHLASGSMRMTSSAGMAELGEGCNEVDTDTTEGAQMSVCCLNKQSVSARVIRVYTTQTTYARFPPLKLGACFVSAVCHVDCPIVWRQYGTEHTDLHSYSTEKNFNKPKVENVHTFEIQYDSELR